MLIVIIKLIVGIIIIKVVGKIWYSLLFFHVVSLGAIECFLFQVIHQKRALLEKLQSLHAIMTRKHLMEEKRLATKSRISAARAGHSLLCASQMPKMPRIGPEWTMRRDTLHRIDDPYQALHFMMGALEIIPK